MTTTEAIVPETSTTEATVIETSTVNPVQQFSMTAKKLGEKCNKDGECGENAKCGKNECKCKYSDGY